MSNRVNDTRSFTVDGIEYMVKQPSTQNFSDAMKIHKKVFNEELQAGSLLRTQLDEELRKRKLWSDDREKRYTELSKEIIDCEYQLAKGGIKLSEAKKIALNMRELRDDMVKLLSSRTELDSNTCEGRADSARFNYLFTCCLVYKESGELYFKNGVDDFLASQNDEVAQQGANEFFYLISDMKPADDNLVENKFLKKFKFVDDHGRLIDDKGRLISSTGRHINEEGNFIEWISDTNYIKVDIDGRPLNDNDEFDVESMPFLDEDGKPIEDVEIKEEPKKRKSKKEIVDDPSPATVN